MKLNCRQSSLLSSSLLSSLVSYSYCHYRSTKTTTFYFDSCTFKHDNKNLFSLLVFTLLLFSTTCEFVTVTPLFFPTIPTSALVLFSITNRVRTQDTSTRQVRFYNHHQKQNLLQTCASTSDKNDNTVSNNQNSYEFESQKLPEPLQPVLIPKSTSNIIMKAWTCHGRTQQELVDRLIQAKIIRTVAVRQAMLQVDRKYYVLDQTSSSTTENNMMKINNDDITYYCYNDTPQPIGLGQTISAPHMHAHALEEIVPYLFRTTSTNSSTTERAEENDDSATKNNFKKILDVGCGSGYLTACFGRLFQSEFANTASTTASNNNSLANNTEQQEKQYKPILPFQGKVFGIDIQPNLVQLATTNIQKNDNDLLKNDIVQLMVVNGWDGYPNEAPYDAIHVGAAASTFPYKLAQQLKVNGVLIVPIGPTGGSQSLYKVERISSKQQEPQQSSTTTTTDTSNDSSSFDLNEYKVTELLGVRYVPLINGPTTTTAQQNRQPSSSSSTTGPISFGGG